MSEGKLINEEIKQMLRDLPDGVASGVVYKPFEYRYEFEFKDPVSPTRAYSGTVSSYEGKKIEMLDKERYTKLLWFAAKHICNTDPAWSLNSPAEVVEYLEGEISK